MHHLPFFFLTGWPFLPFLIISPSLFVLHLSLFLPCFQAWNKQCSETSDPPDESASKRIRNGIPIIRETAAEIVAAHLPVVGSDVGLLVPASSKLPLSFHRVYQAAKRCVEQREHQTDPNTTTSRRNNRDNCHISQLHTSHRFVLTCQILVRTPKVSYGLRLD